jgi:hypothetical protein
MKTDEHLYTISRTEFANEQDKSREAIKKAMSRGKYQDLYIFKNGKYFFKSRQAVGENIALSPLPVSPSKIKINRGGHESAVKKGRYPNQAFANHNHIKKMVALRGRMSPEELALVPTVEAMVKEQRRKDLRDNEDTLRNTRGNTLSDFKHYGTGLINMSNKGYNSPGYHNGSDHHNWPNKYKTTNRGQNINKKGPYEI